MEPRILVISPVRNEARHIELVIRGMAAQELKPARWIVIDDSSTDGTGDVLRAHASEVPFMEVREAPANLGHHGVRDRLARAAAPRNFNLGLASADLDQYTHVMKLDGDIELAPDYFRTLMDRFEADPELGLAGGVLIEPTEDGGMRPIKIPRTHVHGALKCYSVACFRAIGGVQERLGWDTIDETYARMRGYRTVSYLDMVSIHHRPLSSADGILRGRARLGECAYIAQYPPLWVLLRSLKVATWHPRGISGLAFFYGYVRSAIRRVQRVPDSEYRRFTRRELRGRMVHAVVPRRTTAP
jgi:glycosyltransferase involved in cell wall biosynthesis